MKRKTHLLALGVAAVVSATAGVSESRATVIMNGDHMGQCTEVDRMISLVIDVSGSIDNDEYALQMEGWASAISAASGNILSYSNGVAFNVVMFASNAAQVVPWTLLTTQAQIDAFASTVENFARPGNLGERTDIQDGIDVAVDTILDSQKDKYCSDTIIIDVSGDGEQNEPGSVTAARDNALANGVDRINGLVVGGGQALVDYYNNNVKGGPGSFVLFADDFDAFEKAAIEKIGRETGGEVPEPSRAVFSLLGLMGALAVRRRPRKA